MVPLPPPSEEDFKRGHRKRESRSNGDGFMKTGRGYVGQRDVPA